MKFTPHPAEEKPMPPRRFRALPARVLLGAALLGTALAASAQQTGHRRGKRGGG